LNQTTGVNSRPSMERPFTWGKAETLYGLPVDTETAFSNHKGIYKRRIERRQRKLLRKIQFLAPFLEHDEKILQVTIGCSPISPIEQFLTGAILYTLKKALFVFTNRRILHIPCSPLLNYRDSISQIIYADCRTLRIRFSSMLAKYKSGKSEKFPCMNWKNRKKIKEIISKVSYSANTSQELERTHLCPQCSRTLIKNVYICPHCSIKFKNKVSATVFSMIIPGWGYFYTRHPVLGILQFSMESLFTLMLVALSFARYKHWHIATQVHSDGRSIEQAIIVCAGVIVLEKFVTILFANKGINEFIPTKGKIEAQADEINEYRSSPKFEELRAAHWRSR
jgi:hypothetical protein